MPYPNHIQTLSSHLVHGAQLGALGQHVGLQLLAQRGVRLEVVRLEHVAQHHRHLRSTPASVNDCMPP